MNSKRCHLCGLVNFAESENCTRCGEKLLSMRQAEYRESLSFTPGPVPQLSPAKSSPAQPKHFAWAIAGIFLILGLAYFLSLPPSTKTSASAQSQSQASDSSSSYSPTDRTLLVGHMQEEYEKSGWNVRLSVSGPQNDTILMTSPLFAGGAGINFSSLPAFKNFKERMRAHGFREVIFSDGDMPVGKAYLD